MIATTQVREHYETERESIVEKFNEVKDKLAQEREETSSLRKVLNIIKDSVEATI